ncbi:tripartite tricarboxylate transporter TctB family protein [Streptomyces sp. DG2A-72]|uniref:tripartite tricarboxylate transporter TctB family protein n=1 Tax=Streptomyces sp. DG2A-72 TaxID=3051386 RepID=UPI00265C2828|nr:tripartite tricarboxylate transporter TctB family protein [Streptomyces sp. DG2A-72]MDO0939269.1 tripartite tricarboxylate transporter TctB family protein [Streptomyces sp. DG2A-72]
MSDLANFYEEKRKTTAAEREQDRHDRADQREQDRQDRLTEREQNRKDKAEDREEERRLRQEKERKAKAHRAERRARRAELVAKARGAGDTGGALVAMFCSILPALYFQLRALDTANLPVIISLCLAVMLESGAWVATVAGERAKREGRPTLRFRIVMWACASFAALINYSHAPGPEWLGWVLAATSYGGVFFWEVRGWGRHGKATRTKAQRRETRLRNKHDRRRRRRFKDVYERYEDIVAAYPFGTVDREKAWALAWRDRHGAALSITADVLARRVEADVELAEAAGMSAEAIAVERLIDDILGGDGGPEGPLAKPAGRGPSGGPSKGGRSLRTLGRKGKAPVRRTSGRTAPKTPNRPLDSADLDKVRALADALGGAHNLSVASVGKAIHGGSTDYLKRLRDHVQHENKEKGTTR